MLKGRKLQMIEALKSTLTIVTPACKRVGINRDTHYEWLKTDKEYKDEVEKVSLDKKDFVETAFIKLITEGNSQAIIMANKMLNKDRGYIEQPQFEINNTIIDKQLNMNMNQIMDMVDELEDGR